MIWLVYGAVVFIVSGLIGLHLGKFREAYTEMTGMMAGMMMGMLNGFLLGYAAGAATASMFWGNLIGIILGLAFGVYYGRAGSLMGMMDGGMGGVMGGSMGAMLALMVYFPLDGLLWTAVLLAVIYVVGMLGLLVLIEQSAPDHAAFHRFLPVFARVMAVEAAEEAGRAGSARLTSGRPLPIVDYYALLGLPTEAAAEDINEVYLAKLSQSEGADVALLERAVAILSDPNRRRAYDARLRACCPPRKKARSQDDQPGQVMATTAVSLGAAKTQALSQTLPARSRVSTTLSVGAAAKGKTNNSAEKQLAPHGPQQPSSNHKATPRQANPTRRPQPVRSSRQAAGKESPISGVGIFIGALLVTILIGWWAANNGVAPQLAGANNSAAPPIGHIEGVPEDQAALEAKAVSAQIEGGVQTVDFVVIGDSMSYRPKVIKVKQGMPVRFNVTVEGRDPG